MPVKESSNVGRQMAYNYLTLKGGALPETSSVLVSA